MKTLSRGPLIVILFTATSVFAGTSPMSVLVSDAKGKASFKGMTDAKGTFATSNLPAGNYVVQFTSKNADVKGKFYAVAVSAGKKKVSASAVPGEKFNAGGIAMKVDVGANLNITGQVVLEDKVNKSGKKMVWIPPKTGSNFGGHWVEEGSAEEMESRARGVISSDRVNDMQNRGVSPGSGGGR